MDRGVVALVTARTKHSSSCYTMTKKKKSETREEHVDTNAEQKENADSFREHIETLLRGEAQETDESKLSLRDLIKKRQHQEDDPKEN